MTPKVQEFIAANAKSPVVAGSAIGRGGEGGHYTLEDGTRFTLTANECRIIGLPRWKIG